MSCRATSLAVCGVLALGLAGCSGGTSPRSSATTTTVARTGSTIRTTPTVLVNPTTTTTVFGAPAAGADGPTDQSGATSPASSPASTRPVTATAAAARVVTKPSDNVHLGDTGSGVKQVQAALAAQGYKVSADGSFGPQTEQAVKAFQAKSGLKQDGIVGPATWARLQAAPTTATTKPATATSTTKPKATTTTIKK